MFGAGRALFEAPGVQGQTQQTSSGSHGTYHRTQILNKDYILQSLIPIAITVSTSADVVRIKEASKFEADGLILFTSFANSPNGYRYTLCIRSSLIFCIYLSG